jgi:hypothetical protein
MFPSFFPRLTAVLLLSAVLLSALPGCTKRIDTSTENKYYKSLTEVMNSLPASKRREFDEGMSMFWFYSESDEATNAMINGKSGTEILALIEEMKASLPKLDTSSREAYESSLAKIKAGLPPSKVNDFNAWLKEMPAYRQGNPKLDALNGMTFQKIVENRDFSNGQNHGKQQQQ